MSNLSELHQQNFDRISSIGQSLNDWNKQIFNNGDPKKFALTLKGDIMNDFEKAIEEQNNTMKELITKWGETFGKIKQQVEDHKHLIKKNVGDIKDQVERLKQAMDLFNKSIGDEKLRKVTEDIVLLKETLEKLSQLEKTGLLEKLLDVFKK